MTERLLVYAERVLVHAARWAAAWESAMLTAREPGMEQRWAIGWAKLRESWMARLQASD